MLSAPLFLRLIIMKMKMKIKNRSHSYDINRRMYRHGHKYNKHKQVAQYDDAYMYEATLKQHLKLNS